jgi:hypothetical protein
VRVADLVVAMRGAQLVEICEAVIAAHKGPQQAGAEGQTIADHQRIFKEMLSKKQVTQLNSMI